MRIDATTGWPVMVLSGSFLKKFVPFTTGSNVCCVAVAYRVSRFRFSYWYDSFFQDFVDAGLQQEECECLDHRVRLQRLQFLLSF